MKLLDIVREFLISWQNNFLILQGTRSFLYSIYDMNHISILISSSFRTKLLVSWSTMFTKGLLNYYITIDFLFKCKTVLITMYTCRAKRWVIFLTIICRNIKTKDYKWVITTIWFLFTCKSQRSEVRCHNLIIEKP